MRAISSCCRRLLTTWNDAMGRRRNANALPTAQRLRAYLISEHNQCAKEESIRKSAAIFGVAKYA